MVVTCSWLVTMKGKLSQSILGIWKTLIYEVMTVVGDWKIIATGYLFFIFFFIFIGLR